MREHVAGVDEADDAERRAHRRAQLGVEDHQPVAADRKPFVVERVACLAAWRPDAIEREAADRGVAAGVEALALRQRVGFHVGKPLSEGVEQLAGKAGGQPEPRVAGEHERGWCPARRETSAR